MSAIICFNISPVSAQELHIDLVESYTSGTDTILNVTVTHISPSMPDRYNPLDFVDHLELEIDGAFPYILVDTTQYEVQHFSVQYNMGELTVPSTVRVRAMRLQGPGEWSEYVTIPAIPEFSLIHLAPILMITSIAILLIKSKITAKSKK
jgi:hypothetical protein